MTDGTRANMWWSKVICKQPGDYIGWPTIARKSDGEILVVFSGERETHVCPYGKTQLVRSRDGGETWSAAETINNSALDDRDAGVVVMPSGTIVVSWFTSDTLDHLDNNRDRMPGAILDGWVRHCRKIPEELRRQWMGKRSGDHWARGHWTSRSTDGGRTWEPAVDSIVTASHGPIALSDGRLLYVGNADIDGKRALLAAESTDEGQSWHRIGEVPVPDEHAVSLPYHEPHSVELQDGRIVCLWRFGPRDRPIDDWYLQQTEGDDGGRTWTVTRPTPMWGYPPYLVRLQSGDLLATYGYRRPPYGQRACLSHDGGQTWDIESEVVLRDDGINADLGYPATLELEPGELLTVYYQIDEPLDKTGDYGKGPAAGGWADHYRTGEQREKPSLMATRWSLT